MKRPAYQWYPGDFRRDMGLQTCSWEARSLWRDLLDIMHDGQPYGHLAVNGNPIPLERVAAMVGLAVPRVRKYVAELEAAGVSSRTEAGVLFSRRMVRDEEIRTARAEGGSKSQNHPNVPKAKDTLEGYPPVLPLDDPQPGPSGGPSGGPLQSASAVASAPARNSLAAGAANGAVPVAVKRVKPSRGPPVGPPDWVNQAVEIYAAHIGVVTHGKAGKLLKPVVDRRGWAEVKQSLECFCELAPYEEYLTRMEANTLRPGEEKVKKLGYHTSLAAFVERYTYWLEQATT